MKSVMPMRYWMIFLGSIIGIAVVFGIAAWLMLGNKKAPENVTNESIELGNVSIAEKEDVDLILNEGDSEYSPVDNIPTCAFSGIDQVTDLFTIGVLQNLSSEFGKWLLLQGVDEDAYVELTILSKSIVNDTTYPYFRCKDKEGNVYAIGYRTDTREFEFSKW